MSNLRVSVIVLAIIISWINHLNSEPVEEKQQFNHSTNLTRKHDNGQEAERLRIDNSGDSGKNKLGQIRTQNVLGQEKIDKGTLNLTASRRKRYIEFELWPELQQEKILLNGERHGLRIQKPGNPIISDVFNDIWGKKTKKPKLTKTPKPLKHLSQVEDPENPIDLDKINNLKINRKRFPVRVLWRVIKHLFKKPPKKIPIKIPKKIPKKKPQKYTKPSKTNKKTTKKPSESESPEIPSELQTPDEPNFTVEINVYPEFHFNIDGNLDSNDSEIISAIETILKNSDCGRLLNTIGGKKLILN